MCAFNYDTVVSLVVNLMKNLIQTYDNTIYACKTPITVTKSETSHWDVCEQAFSRSRSNANNMCANANFLGDRPKLWKMLNFLHYLLFSLFYISFSIFSSIPIWLLILLASRWYCFCHKTCFKDHIWAYYLFCDIMKSTFRSIQW